MDDDGWSKFLLSNRNSPPLLNDPVRRSHFDGSEKSCLNRDDEQTSGAAGGNFEL
jgi:hypothetical protein